MDEIQFAFMAEYGDYHFDFDKDGVSSKFIIASILVKESNVQMLEQVIERISQTYFSNLAGKSSLFEIDDQQIIRILNELKDLPFSVYAYVIDKRKVRENSGIMHQKPFFKYVNRMVHGDLSQSFEQLDLVADAEEAKPFMREFKNYIMSNTIPDLFNYSSFGFNDNHSDLLLQLANFISMVLAKGYESIYQTVQYQSFFKIIKHKFAAINLLPHDYKNFLFHYKPETHHSQYNDVIIKQAVSQAYKYIEKHQKSEEEEEKLRLYFLKFLLFNLKENPDEYVYTQEILDNLNAIRDVKMGQHYFRSNIVSKLRDSGLLIASSNKGYKLPASLNDLYDFVNLSSLTIYPMIHRIAKCREQILVATNQEIDILEQKEYEYLKKVIEMNKLRV